MTDEEEHYIDTLDDYFEDCEETEEDRFYRTATLWQKICRHEPNHIKRLKKYIWCRLEQHCSKHVGRVHFARQRNLPLPGRFQNAIFRIASWIEFRVRNTWRK